MRSRWLFAALVLAGLCVSSCQETVILLVEPLTISPAAGSYAAAQAVTMATATPDAEIYYTEDGTEPTRAGTLYSGAFTVKSTCVIRARAFLEGMDPSPIEEAEYAIHGGFVAAGGGHNIAVRTDGTVWAWGNNLGGMLGIGSTDCYAIPVPVSGLENAVAAACGDTHSLVFGATLMAMGGNAQGQVGDGSQENQVSPVAVAAESFASPVISLAGGYNHSLAVTGSGEVWAWGDDAYGQLGDGETLSDSLVPVHVQGLSDVVAVAAGDCLSLALKADGTVWAWGDDAYGQLGNDSTLLRSPVPVQVSGITTAVAVAAGDSHGLALLSDGTVTAWGSNVTGQLGDGTNTQRPTPVAVSGLTSVASLAAGYYHSFALLADGTVQTWGYNAQGQLGDGTTTNSNVPVAVLDIEDAVQVSGGMAHSIAVLEDGTARAWGWNILGQLGNASTDTCPVPVVVFGLKLW